MAKKKRLSQEDRRHQIIHVAMALFASKGFKGTTTRAIAKTAGVSEAIIFRHFATKEDLYDAIINFTVEQRHTLWEQDEASLNPTQDLKTHLSTFAEAYIQRNRNDPTFIRLMMYSALEDHKFREKFFEIYHSPHLQAIQKTIQKGIERKIYRAVDPTYTIRSFFSTLLQYCISRFIANNQPVDRLSDKEMTDNLVDIFLYGLESPSNKKR